MLQNSNSSSQTQLADTCKPSQTVSHLSAVQLINRNLHFGYYSDIWSVTIWRCSSVAWWIVVNGKRGSREQKQWETRLSNYNNSFIVLTGGKRVGGLRRACLKSVWFLLHILLLSFSYWLLRIIAVQQHVCASCDSSTDSINSFRPQFLFQCFMEKTLFFLASVAWWRHMRSDICILLQDTSYSQSKRTVFNHRN